MSELSNITARLGQIEAAARHGATVDPILRLEGIPNAIGAATVEILDPQSIDAAQTCFLCARPLVDLPAVACTPCKVATHRTCRDRIGGCPTVFCRGSTGTRRVLMSEIRRSIGWSTTRLRILAILLAGSPWIMLDPDPRLLHLTGCLVFLLLPATAASLIQRGWDARRLGEKGLAAWTLLEILGRNRPTTAQIDAAQMRHSPNQGSSASLLYAAAGIVLAVPLRGHVPPGPWVAVLDGVLTLSGLVLVTALLRRLARGLKSGTGDLDPRILRVWRHWIQGLEDQMPPG